jgi:hypothetical protein
MLRFIRHQFKHGCRSGFGRRKAITRAVRTYLKGF